MRDSMRVEVVSTEEASDLRSDWARIVESNPKLQSPFYRPEFSMIVGERRKALVAIVDDGKAFFPFHRQAFGVGKPIANGISDYQGIVAADSAEWGVAELITKSGLRAFQFNHVASTQTGFAPYSNLQVASPRIVLDKVRVSKKLRKHIANRRRKLERELGPVRFELRSLDYADFNQCLAWKREQYTRTGALALEWVQHTLRRIRETDGPGFSGILSTLKVSDRLIAVHFGLKSHQVLHYWMPSYDPAFASFSPGMMLLLDMISCGYQEGLKIFDLGRGDQDYKYKLANDAHQVLEGYVSMSPIASAVLWARDSTRTMLRKTLRGRRRLETDRDQVGRLRALQLQRR